MFEAGFRSKGKTSNLRRPSPYRERRRVVVAVAMLALVTGAFETATIVALVAFIDGVTTGDLRWEVAVGPLELTLDYGGEVTFVDRETGERLRSQPWFVRKDYRSSVGEWTSYLERRCVENAIDYALLTTDTPFDEALVRYLGKRGRMG